MKSNRTPAEALKRSGHKFPEDIVSDLNNNGFVIIKLEKLAEILGVKL